MTELADLTLTPRQALELNDTDQGLVEAWLAALDSTPDVRSPVGWLLAGIRTGQPPADVDDARLRLATLKAERLIRNHRGNIPTEAELIETLFAPAELTADVATLERIGAGLSSDAEGMLGPTLRAQLAHTRTHGRQEIPGSGGPLRGFDTPVLRERMLKLWRSTRPNPLRSVPDVYPHDPQTRMVEPIDRGHTVLAPPILGSTPRIDDDADAWPSRMAYEPILDAEHDA